MYNCTGLRNRPAAEASALSSRTAHLLCPGGLYTPIAPGPLLGCGCGKCPEQVISDGSGNTVSVAMSVSTFAQRTHVPFFSELDHLLPGSHCGQPLASGCRKHPRKPLLATRRYARSLESGTPPLEAAHSLLCRPWLS